MHSDAMLERRKTGSLVDEHAVVVTKEELIYLHPQAARDLHRVARYAHELDSSLALECCIVNGRAYMSYMSFA